MCDGILFTGGQDVNPTLYGEKVTPEYQATKPELSAERDAMEPPLLDTMIQFDKPVLGICRGIQLINACLGGTLWRDLPSEHPSDVKHHMMKPPYDAFGHDVTVEPGTPLDDMLNGMPQSQVDESTMKRNDDGNWSIAVNSYHHQAVRTVAPTLKVMATATASRKPYTGRNPDSCGRCSGIRNFCTTSMRAAVPSSPSSSMRHGDNPLLPAFRLRHPVTLH